MLGWELPPYNSGGLGVACFQMCKALAKKGVDIDFVVPYCDKHENIDFMTVKGASQNQFRATTILGAYDTSFYDYHTANQTKGSSLYQQIDSYTFGVAEIAKNSDFDMIHAHDWLTFRAALRAKELSGRPLVAHVHATEFDRAGGNSGNPLIHEIEQTGLMLADKILAISQFTKDMIVKEYGIPADKIDIVRNSIDADSYGRLEKANVHQYLRKDESQWLSCSS